MKKIIYVFVISMLIVSCNNNEISQETEKTLIVASKQKDCVGLGPQKCMLIKENNQQNWSFFYDTIEGFSYEEGFEYEILVSEEEIENPPQDASSIKTKLIKIVSKVKKTSANLPN